MPDKFHTETNETFNSNNDWAKIRQLQHAFRSILLILIRKFDFSSMLGFCKFQCQSLFVMPIFSVACKMHV